eukprot:TRINITY_DN6359_c0_g1_i1.p1 TRINITY_DN6359_c0_g1~~TRINITY_DN6359_c0_g1_i1.p1  ORF type:complete len:83 (+),score=4.14 TRINITY_DN6359_c0_g1_i1:139-387(+)
MTKLHILESQAILLRISEARLESNLVDTKENLYWMFRAVGRSKFSTIHTFESLADHMKILENIISIKRYLFYDSEIMNTTLL